MRRIILITSLLLVVFFLSLSEVKVQAQPYPSRTIQIFCVSPAGGGQDLVARLDAEELKRILGVDVIVVSKPGAGFTLGTDAVAKSKKDGYTIAFTNAPGIVHTRVLNPETVPYDPEKDLEPLGLNVFLALPVVVQEKSPWKTFNQFIDEAKKNPGKIRVGVSGIGTPSHFNCEIVQYLTGAQFTITPFKGGQSVVTPLLGGHVDVIFDSIGNVLPHIESRELKMLLNTRKMPQFPDVPIITELGYKQDLLSAWHAYYAPAGIPEEARKVLVSAIEKAAKNPESRAKCEKMGYIVDYKSPEELKRLAANDFEVALGLARKLGLRK
jgi:tripartite-type tricarboxylate transporter receptor subunit TctC